MKYRGPEVGDHLLSPRHEVPILFRYTSMKEGTSAHLSGRGELHGGARVITLVL